MTTTTINIRIDKATKLQAQAVAKELGVDLSTAFHGLIRRFIKEKTITFEPLPVLNPATLKRVRQSEGNYKAGKYSSFDSTDDLVLYLTSPNANTSLKTSRKKNQKAR